MLIHPVHSFNVTVLSCFAVILLLLSACGTTSPIAGIEDMEPSSLTPEELLSVVPDYSDNLNTLQGTGRAIVSEPGSSERVTLQFYSNRDQSLITIRTGVGIEGGQILVDRDSLLIYNRVDSYAEQVSLNHSNLTSIGSLASLNMLDMFNFTFSESAIDAIYENDGFYMAILDDGTQVTISKTDRQIRRVVQTRGDAAYGKIEYEGYARIEDFYLPRKITILSNDGRSQATFLVQRLDVNKSLPPLQIDLPDDIPIYRL
jgi:outer membrane lipoprotein-sorting protein